MGEEARQTFSVGNAYGLSSSPSSFSLASAYSGAITMNNDTLPAWNDAPLWVQILYGARYASGVLDPYIYSPQEQAQVELLQRRLEVEKLLAQAELEKARQAGIRVEPETSTPAWVWALVAAGAVVVVLLLVNRE